MSIQPSFDNPQPVVDIPRPIVLRFQGLHPRDFGRFRMHDERRGGDLSHVDAEMTGYNEILFGDVDWVPRLRAEVAHASRGNLEEHVAALRAKSRRKEAQEVNTRGLLDPWQACRHGPLREGILTVNKAWFGGTARDRWDTKKVQAFRDQAMAFLAEHFPDGQLRYASGHSDEEAYHIHFVVAVWRERVTANRGRQFLLQASMNRLIASYEHAQDMAGEVFADLGIVRGVRRAEAIRAAKAAGEPVPKKRRHIPPSTHRIMEKLHSHIYAARTKKNAALAAGRIADEAVADATETRRQAKEVLAREKVRAELTRLAALDAKSALLDTARNTGTTILRKSRKHANREVRERRQEIAREQKAAGLDLELLVVQARREGKAAADALRRRVGAEAATAAAEEQRMRDEAAADLAQEQRRIAERAAMRADALVTGYENRAEAAAQRMQILKAEKVEAEHARDRAKAATDAENARMAAIVLQRRAEEDGLSHLRAENRSQGVRLQDVIKAADEADLRLSTAVLSAEAVEHGLNLIAEDILRGVEGKEGGQPGLAWGAGAPKDASARIRLFERVSAAEPMLLRITRMVARVVRALLAQERRLLAEDAAFVTGLHNDLDENQRAQLRNIAEGRGMDDSP